MREERSFARKGHRKKISNAWRTVKGAAVANVIAKVWALRQPVDLRFEPHDLI